MSRFQVGVFYAPEKKHSFKYLEAFEAGIKKHGHPVTVIQTPHFVECDLAVCWGFRLKYIQYNQKRLNADYLILERGYVGDRFAYSSCGFNGLNGRADFSYAPTEKLRLEEYFNDEFITLNKTEKKHILVIGQLFGDASVEHVNIREWEKETIAVLSKLYPQIPIIYRPHPIEIKHGIQHTYVGATNSKNKKLADDLQEAIVCVTFNSTSAVEAVLADVPTISCDAGSMAYDITSHELTTYGASPNRREWAEKLVWKQFSIQEFQSGYAWDILRRHYK